MTCVNQNHSDTGADKQKIQFHSVSPLALIFYMPYTIVYQAIFDQIDLCLITLIKQLLFKYKVNCAVIKPSMVQTRGIGKR